MVGVMPLEPEDCGSIHWTGKTCVRCETYNPGRTTVVCDGWITRPNGENHMIVRSACRTRIPLVGGSVSGL